MPNLSSSQSSVSQFNQSLCEFLDASPTPFHATATMAAHLDAAGFIALDEHQPWTLQAGQAYYVTRNQSSLIAWTQGEEPLTEQGIRMLGAHTDSPCLKVKPQADLHDYSSWRLAVEVYGGVLLAPWFDRDLSLAGRVHFRHSDGSVASALVDFKCPIATIPNLAIHLNREANIKRTINPQTELPVLLACGDSSRKQSLNDLLLAQLNQAGEVVDRILDHELCFYDTQAASVVGINGDFIASARLDNLLSCFVGLNSLMESFADSEAKKQWSLLVCSDHEEVGSRSTAGAAGTFLIQVLQRLLPDSEGFARAINQSMMISTDNAHALHPAHADKMDANHSPLINAGPVIKVNANQSYASNSETQALFRNLCADCDIPVQTFVTRNDMGCGSTIGPITAAGIGVKTLDIGLPTYAMHSIRELAGSQDPAALKTVLLAFLARA